MTDRQTEKYKTNLMKTPKLISCREENALPLSGAWEISTLMNLSKQRLTSLS